MISGNSFVDNITCAVVFITNQNDIRYLGRNLKAILVFDQYNILSLESGNKATSCFA